LQFNDSLSNFFANSPIDFVNERIQKLKTQQKTYLDKVYNYSSIIKTFPNLTDPVHTNINYTVKRPHSFLTRRFNTTDNESIFIYMNHI